MDRKRIPSDKITSSTKKKRLIIALEQKFDVLERRERSHSNFKLRRDVYVTHNLLNVLVQIANKMGFKQKSL
jgi:hypothetical protein